MRTFLLALSLCLMAGLAACRTDENVTQPPAQTDQQATRPATDVVEPAPVELTVEGELRSIDLTNKTLVLKDVNGNERTFSFTESTSTIGASGVQGLSGKQGSHAKIGYVTQGDTNAATWIEISPVQKEPARK